jgi:hypothetical protein
MTSEPGAGPNTSAPATFLVRPLGTSHGLSRFWIEQPMEDLLEKENEVLNRLQRDVKWPGFRRGGVPIPKIRQRYAGGRPRTGVDGVDQRIRGASVARIQSGSPSRRRWWNRAMWLTPRFALNLRWNAPPTWM